MFRLVVGLTIGIGGPVSYRREEMLSCCCRPQMPVALRCRDLIIHQGPLATTKFVGSSNW